MGGLPIPRIVESMPKPRLLLSVSALLGVSLFVITCSEPDFSSRITVDSDDDGVGSSAVLSSKAKKKRKKRKKKTAAVRVALDLDGLKVEKGHRKEYVYYSRIVHVWSANFQPIEAT